MRPVFETVALSVILWNGCTSNIEKWNKSGEVIAVAMIVSLADSLKNAENRAIAGDFNRFCRAEFTRAELNDLRSVFQKGHDGGLFLTFAIHREDYRDHEVSFHVIPVGDPRPVLIVHKNLLTGSGIFNCIEIPARNFSRGWTQHFGIALSRFNQTVERMARGNTGPWGLGKTDFQENHYSP